jgi:hypothetical protein
MIWRRKLSISETMVAWLGCAEKMSRNCVGEKGPAAVASVRAYVVVA